MVRMSLPPIKHRDTNAFNHIVSEEN
jgi:hypothetical protein